jgi:hypothetical protein
MYTVTNTTDGKYVGNEIENLDNPIKISKDLTFQYDKKGESGNDVVLSNSNYIINLIKQ